MVHKVLQYTSSDNTIRRPFNVNSSIILDLACYSITVPEIILIFPAIALRRRRRKPENA
ncbi:MAG: hypothetical protein ABSD92_13810 [Candidatus Bathyarchaeia archaeon]